jgi:hypothetical protein
MASIINALSSGTGGIVTAGDASGILQLQTANTAAVTIDASQNVGIGVTPSAWYSTYRALSIGYSSNGMFSGGAIQLGLTQNSYLDSGLNYVYTTSNPASQYIQQSGVHTWRSAASGTAGNAITFTQLLAVEKDKSLALQGATSATGTGIAFPATQSASSDANTLDDYREGSYTGTLTGCTTSPTTTVYYTKIGNIVHLSNLAAGITGTSNASTMRLTGMPALIRPTNASKGAVQGGISGSVSQSIWVQVLSNGDIYCESGGSSWPTSGVKGFDSGFGITYSIL